MTDIYKSPCGRMELRLGRWQDVLTDIETCDAVITDPPYSERTHKGHYAGAKGAERSRDGWGYDGTRTRILKTKRRVINYGFWNKSDRVELSDHWAKHCNGWICICADNEIYGDYREALENSDRYVFHPIPLVMWNMTVRLSGDGPASWCVWLIVARPKTTTFARWGALPGAYDTTAHQKNRGTQHIGGKPLELMRPIIRDYTKRGDLIIDPCSGYGTTLLAAAIEGRRCIGAEQDPDTYAKAVKRLKSGYTPTLF